MSVRFDSIEIEILSSILKTPKKRLQRKDIRDAVFEENKNYNNKDTFNVVLQRKLNNLCISKLLRKDDVGHRQVYYYIPNKEQDKALDIIEEHQMTEDFNFIVEHELLKDENEWLRIRVKKLLNQWKQTKTWLGLIIKKEHREALFKELAETMKWDVVTSTGIEIGDAYYFGFHDEIENIQKLGITLISLRRSLPMVFGKMVIIDSLGLLP